MDTVDARGLPGHAASSWLAAKQPNGVAHAGQPVPTYSTVSLAVAPHVVTFSVPPGATPAPSDREYTRRDPEKKVLKPATQLPDVYMLGQPASAVDRSGAAPVRPASGSVRGRPRQIGGEEDWDGVAHAVALGDGVPVRVEEPVLVTVAAAVGVRVPEAIGLKERV